MWTLVFMSVAVGLLAFWLVGVSNAIVRARHEAENGWSQVEVQLQRRLDLIPGLVETVKGLSQHERETLQKVMEARSSALAPAPNRVARIDTEQRLSGVLADLRTIVESYPQLCADAGFLKLLEQLAQTEDSIARARQFYNDAVMRLRNLREEFPSSLVANRREPDEALPLFTAAKGAEAAPRISFV